MFPHGKKRWIEVNKCDCVAKLVAQSGEDGQVVSVHEAEVLAVSVHAYIVLPLATLWPTW